MLDFKSYKFPSNTLEDKTIVITGAGSGIGREIAKCYSRLGAELILLSKSQDKLETLHDELSSDNSKNILIQPIDFALSEEKDYVQIVEALSGEYSKIDGLVNNAGILGEKKSIEQYNYKTWKQVMKVNLDAGFLLTKNLIPLLRESKSSSVIFTSSGVGKVGRPYWGSYSVSKFATEGLMQILSEELQNTSSIRVNCINPGAVRTKMRKSAYPAEDPEINPLASEIMKPYIFLMSDVSENINGHSIDAQES